MIFSTDSQLSFAALSAEPGSAGTARGLDSLRREEIAERTETARRIIREQGVTCLVGSDSGGGDRTWELDLMPMLISAEEWQMLERGVAQRASLLNLLLRDLYGPQTSLRNGWLPAALVYANPLYSRGCHGIAVHGGNHLPFYAVDMARSPEGRWSVISDRTQTPSGLGFALENRDILTRVLPDVMRTLQPRSLAGVLPLLREALVALSPQNRENPTIVVLTPGPRNESYFEHTYLARMLGFALVEGGDLTVRDRRVFIKTLEGLRSVDVILRRVHDAFCDPLEFRADSLLGVPGLLEAVRAGQVAVGNALGCGLAEAPAFLPFLPGLCHQFLGEGLLLPSVATWWCGQAEPLKHALAHAEALAFRPAFSLQIEPKISAYPPLSVIPPRFQESPHEWIAQEEAVLSSTRIFSGQTPFVLRVFVIGIGSNFHVIPGGLSLLSSRRRQASAFISLATPTKDVWVAPEASPVYEPEPATPPSPTSWLEQAPIDIPSRIADNLFWLGRYTERLENLLRITRCVMGHVSTLSGPASLQRLAVLHELMERLELTPSEIYPGNPPEVLAEILHEIISAPDRKDGVPEIVAHIHQSAFAVRDILSADTWRLFNRMRSDADFEATNRPNLLAASAVLDTLVLDLAAFSGMEMENMTRGHGWIFLDIGRRLERSMNLLALLSATLGSASDVLLYEPLLEICDCVITYRRRHFAEMRLHCILELLLLDGNNPRSLAFQFSALENASRSLPEAPNPDGVANIRSMITSLTPYLRSLGFEIMHPRESVSEKLQAMHELLQEASEMLSQVYFSHTVPRVK